MRTALAYRPSAHECQHHLHAQLSRFNSGRLAPGHICPDWLSDIKTDHDVRVDEGHFVEAEREAIRHAAHDGPEEPGAFVRWFEGLRTSGPGQGDPLFPWLARTATLDQMRWFLTQEAVGASNRRYAYHAAGALGAIEMTAPGRVSQVNEGLKRLDAPANARAYFQLHAGLDVKHSEAWNREVSYSLVETDPRTARPIAEGALMRLECGARRFGRYRARFGLLT